MNPSKLKKALSITLAALLLCCGAVGIYASDYYKMSEAALFAMESSDTITVTNEHGLAVFAPESPQIGLIFYPGGKVEYTAYAPLMQMLAENGVLCAIPHMPLNLAVMGVDAAEEISEQFPKIETWYIGGHSLGGSMAASHASHCDKVKGLILLAAYSTVDLSNNGLRVLSIYGSEDGVLNTEKYAEYFPNLPSDTTEIPLRGGNHAGFGSYGEQKGDGQAYFSDHEQQAMTASAILEFIGLQVPSEEEAYCLYLQDSNGAWLRSVLTLLPNEHQFYLSVPVISSRLNAGSYTIENNVLICSNWSGDAMYYFDVTDEGMIFRSKESAPLYAHASVFDSNPNAQAEVPDGAVYTP